MARVWLIAGPTASGKSALALRLAEAIEGELINADSMQLYADLQVLTARPGLAETARARHHLYGIADAAEAWSVGRWLNAARAALAAIGARGHTAIVVGGTGLYFRALTHGLAETPLVPAPVRARVRAEYDRLGEAAFLTALAALDPAATARIAPSDRQRLMRAMEVVEASGRTLEDWQGEAQPTLSPQDYRAVVLDPARPDLYARCDARLAAMVETGALDEVRALLARGLSPELPVMKALGVRELAANLRGELTLDQALELARRQTRRYVKRQATWFRHQTPDWPRVAKLDPDAQWRALDALTPHPRAP